MSDTKITLYHANWCGHCKSFMKTWNGLKNFFDNHNVKYEDYEESNSKDIIAKKKIKIFPTITITKNNKEYLYNGDKSVNSIINEVLPNLQIGGNKKNYKSKYLKYKLKYLQLLKKKKINE